MDLTHQSSGKVGSVEARGVTERRAKRRTKPGLIDALSPAGGTPRPPVFFWDATMYFLKTGFRFVHCFVVPLQFEHLKPFCRDIFHTFPTLYAKHHPLVGPLFILSCRICKDMSDIGPRIWFFRTFIIILACFCFNSGSSKNGLKSRRNDITFFTVFFPLPPPLPSPPILVWPP